MTAIAPRFIHLRVRSALTLLQSMIRPKDLAKWAKASEAPAVGVTDDHEHLCSMMEASLYASGV